MDWLQYLVNPISVIALAGLGIDLLILLFLRRSFTSITPLPADKFDRMLNTLDDMIDLVKTQQGDHVASINRLASELERSNLNTEKMMTWEAERQAARQAHSEEQARMSANVQTILAEVKKCKEGK